MCQIGTGLAHLKVLETSSSRDDVAGKMGKESVTVIVLPHVGVCGLGSRWTFNFKNDSGPLSRFLVLS
jgi:hypothetical protein